MSTYLPDFTFVVYFTSASDHGHGGGDVSVVMVTSNLEDAMACAEEPVQWGWRRVEVYRTSKWNELQRAKEARRG